MDTDFPDRPSSFLRFVLSYNQFYKYQELEFFFSWKEGERDLILDSIIVFNWNHFEMRLLNLRINFYLLWTFCPHLGSFLFCFFFHYVSAKFYLWPSSGDLPRPGIGMLSLVTVSPVITAFHSCCLLHHDFGQVNLWPAWVGFETAIFWQCSPGTVETQRFYPLRHGPRRAIKDGFFGLMEGSNYWGYGYKTQHSYPRSR